MVLVEAVVQRGGLLLRRPMLRPLRLREGGEQAGAPLVACEAERGCTGKYVVRQPLDER